MFNYRVQRGSFITPQNLLNTLTLATLPVTSVTDIQDGYLISFSRRLSDAEDTALFEIITPPTANELTLRAKYTNSRIIAAAIPGWATWTEAEAETWKDNNIGTPLAAGRSQLPATLTLATTRLAIMRIWDILDAMLVLLWALARMVIALRDHTWPDLAGVSSGVQANKK